MDHLTYHRLQQIITSFKKRNQYLVLTSKGVKTPGDKHGRAPMDFTPCIPEVFKKNKKGKVVIG